MLFLFHFVAGITVSLDAACSVPWLDETTSQDGAVRQNCVVLSVALCSMAGECGSCAKGNPRQFERLDFSVEDIEFIVLYQLLRVCIEIIKLKRAMITLET